MVSGTWYVLHKYGSGEKDGDDDEEEEARLEFECQVG